MTKVHSSYYGLRNVENGGIWELNCTLMRHLPTKSCNTETNVSEGGDYKQYCKTIANLDTENPDVG
jgi:hypothetical protein